MASHTILDITLTPQIFDLLHTRHPKIVLRITAVLLSLVVIGFYFFRWSKRLNLPVVGNREDADFRLALKEGVAKFPDTPFVIPKYPLFVIAPKSTLNEFKSFTVEEASFAKFLQHEFHSQSTSFAEWEDGTLISVIRNEITRQLASTLNCLQEETAYAFDSRLGQCQDWTAVKLYPTLAKIVALISARVFVGRPLSRNEEWVDANVNYTFQVINVKDGLPKWPRWIEKVLGPYYDEVKSMKKYKKQYTELVKPTIDAHVAKEGNEKLYSDEGDERGSVIASILDRMPPEERGNLPYIITQLLNLSGAAIHTTTLTTTHVFYDLASHREYIPLLLDEIKEVMAEDGYEITDDGILRMRKTSLPKLLKLDSFLKESQRVNPLSIVSHPRTTTSDLMLSTGHLIPKGTHIGIPSWEIHNSSPELYSEGYTKPLNEFDGLRYYNLRRLPGNANRHFFVSTSPQSLAFGHGKQSCPGRFFANNEIKVILIELLRNWDFRFPDDVNLEGGAWRRPENTFQQFECMPDTGFHLEFRRKKI